MKTYTVKISNDGTKHWFLNGERHREEGPAIERVDGSKEWWLNGQRHRENGPAIERVDGSKSWWLNGKLHREGGPAVEYSDGTKEWYLNGVKYSESQWKEKVEPKKSTIILNGKSFEIDNALVNELKKILTNHTSNG